MYRLVYHSDHDKPWKIWLGNRLAKEFTNKDEAEEFLDWMENIESCTYG